MDIQRCLTLSEFWEERDGRLEVLCACARVILEILKVADPCLLCDGLCLLLVLGELGVYKMSAA